MSSLHFEILTGGQREFLDEMKGGYLPEGAYLAGGTGLALLIGHRRSLDFDFFTENDFIKERLLESFRKLGNLKVLLISRGSVTFEVRNQRISIFHYPHELLFPPVDSPWEFKIADQRDIIPMKLSAIASRGSRKDFADIYFILKNFTLEECFDFLDKKFSGVEYSRYHILRSLLYFEDAEKEPSPEMISSFSWEEAKKHIESCAKKMMNL